MTFQVLISKKCRGKKVYTLAKDVDSKRQHEIKAKIVRLEKGIFLGVTLIQAVEAKRIDFFSPKIIIILQKIKTLNKSLCNKQR